MDSITNLYIGWILYDLLCLFSFISIAFHLKYKDKQIIILYLFVAMLVAILGNAITMDYRAYWKIIQQVVYGSHRYIHLEPIYIEIINKIGANYEIWQTIIYVPAYMAFYLVIKNLCVKHIELFLLLFVVLIMYYECIGSRQFLFITLYYLGVISLAKKKWLFGIIILSISVFFHKMAYMALPLIPFYFISLKNKIGYFILLTIIMTLIVRIILAPFIDTLSMIMGGDGSGYLEENVNGATGSIWWAIINNTNYFIRITLLWYCLYVTRQLSKSENKIQRIMYSLVFFSSCGSIFWGYIGINGTISSRLLSLGSIGFCYLFTFIPELKHITKCRQVLFIISLICYWILTNAFIKGVSNSVMLGELQLE